MGEWQGIFVEPAKTAMAQISQFVVNLFLVLFILLVGWLISRIIKAVVTKTLKIVKLDELSSKIELDTLLKKGGISYSLSDLIGVVVYWLALLITFVVAVNAIGLTIAADLLNRIVLYVPNIIAAIFIIILGMFVATVLKNLVFTAATNAGLSHARLLSRAAETVIVIFAILITLEQLNIGARIIELTISIVLASFGLAFALAFGFGCQDSARKLLNDVIEKFKSKK